MDSHMIEYFILPNNTIPLFCLGTPPKNELCVNLFNPVKPACPAILSCGILSSFPLNRTAKRKENLWKLNFLWDGSKSREPNGALCLSRCILLSTFVSCTFKKTPEQSFDDSRQFMVVVARCEVSFLLIGISSMLILISGLFLHISFTLLEALLFCRSGDCLDEVPFASFLLKDQTGGQPTTGRASTLHQIRALFSFYSLRPILVVVQMNVASTEIRLDISIATTTMERMEYFF